MVAATTRPSCSSTRFQRKTLGLGSTTYMARCLRRSSIRSSEPLIVEASRARGGALARRVQHRTELAMKWFNRRSGPGMGLRDPVAASVMVLLAIPTPRHASTYWIFPAVLRVEIAIAWGECSRRGDGPTALPLLCQCRNDFFSYAGQRPSKRTLLFDS